MQSQTLAGCLVRYCALKRACAPLYPGTLSGVVCTAFLRSRNYQCAFLGEAICLVEQGRIFGKPGAAGAGIQLNWGRRIMGHQEILEMSPSAATGSGEALKAANKMNGEIFAATEATSPTSGGGGGRRNMIDGIEHFAELDQRAEKIMGDLLKLGPDEALKAFENLSNNPTLQKYTALQVAGAFTEAQKKLDAAGRFEFGASSEGDVTLYDKQNPRHEEEVVSAIQMYDDAGLKKARAGEPDEDITEQVARDFAAHDFSKLTAQQIATFFADAANQMKAAGADPSFAASELSHALEKAGVPLAVRSNHGQIYLHTVEEQPRATIKVMPGF